VIASQGEGMDKQQDMGQHPTSYSKKFWPPPFPVHIQSVRFKLFLGTDGNQLLLSPKVPKGTKSGNFKWKIIGKHRGYHILSPTHLKCIHIDKDDLVLAEPSLNTMVEWQFDFEKQDGSDQAYIVEAIKKSLCLASDGKSIDLKKCLGRGGRRWTFHKPQDEHEDMLWEHWIQAHGRENVTLICSICTANGAKPKLVGNMTWGFGNHLLHKHGPKIRQPKPKVNSDAPTFAFSLVICQHPNGKYLLVEEGCNNGWWLPAGRVDPGEDFQTAALRETLEEAGINVKLEGILRIEYSPYKDGGARSRVIFYARPIDPNQQPKTEPDYESLCAVWISFKDLKSELNSRKKHLRGKEPLVWFEYVEKGGTIFPLSILASEGAPPQ